MALRSYSVLFQGLWFRFEAGIVKRVGPQQNSGQIARTGVLAEPCRKRVFSLIQELLGHQKPSKGKSQDS